jgi:sugar phosphate isomerase/epimerase
MKIGFSSSLCPDWDLPQLVQHAQTLGFEALEIAAPDGQQSPVWSRLSDPAEVKRQLGEAAIELTCLATNYSFHWPDRRVVAEQAKALRRVVEVAEQAGCRYVSIKTGFVPKFASRDAVLLRIAHALREAAYHAGEHDVILVVENSGNLASSRDMWFILDAANHPAARCYWNPCNATASGESSGLAVPRIGQRVMLTCMEDAAFSGDGRFERNVPAGQGGVDLDRYLVLMNGIRSDSHLIVQSRKPMSDPQAREMLTASLAWIKDQLGKIDQAPELTAYKGDKYAPRYATRSS